MSDAITRAIDAYGFANYDHAHLINARKPNLDDIQCAAQRVEATYAALLAQIDPERVARLEAVAECARALLARGPYVAALTKLVLAVDALDASTPPEDADAT